MLSGARRGRPIPPPASGRGGSSFLVAAASRRQAPGVDIISLIRRGRAPADPARARPDLPGEPGRPGSWRPRRPAGGGRACAWCIIPQPGRPTRPWSSRPGPRVSVELPRRLPAGPGGIHGLGEPGSVAGGPEGPCLCSRVSGCRRPGAGGSWRHGGRARG